MKFKLINPPSYLSAYLNPVLIDGERWAAVMTLFDGRGRIIMGDWSDTTGYSDGYWYSSLWAAVAALDRWSGQVGTEPQGWERAICLGRVMRRRPDGNPFEEYMDRDVDLIIPR